MQVQQQQVGPVDKEWSSKKGDRLFDLNIDQRETNEKMVVECDMWCRK